ncbi:MAG TPA: hypothetical protein VD767_08430 [Thermomicrobiales bacterium]|nr:hypothetical protein [Thermomicrobiales bacterium]
MAETHYQKPYKPFEERLDLIEERGIAVGDRQEALEHLRRLPNLGCGRDVGFHHPLVNVALVSLRLGVTAATAGKVIERLASLGFLEEITGRQRNRVYRYTPYWALFQEPAVYGGEQAPAQETGFTS